MNMNWTCANGTVEDIRDMQENHLANAYAKSLRDGVNRDTRPALAAEILARRVADLLPPYAKTAVERDALRAA